MLYFLWKKSCTAGDTRGNQLPLETQYTTIASLGHLTVQCQIRPVRSTPRRFPVRPKHVPSRTRVSLYSILFPGKEQIKMMRIPFSPNPKDRHGLLPATRHRSPPTAEMLFVSSHFWYCSFSS